MAATFLLDRATWDICLSAGGNLALATEPYSQEQDVASECRTVLGECYYDTTRGIDYFGSILGQLQPVQVLKQQLTDAALLVPGVTNATVYLTGINNRAISGQIQFNGSSVTL